MSKNATEILNPVSGGMKYTNRPQHFIDMGIAYMCGNKLAFLEEHQARQMIYRDILFWNGDADPERMYKPGEVRS